MFIIGANGIERQETFNGILKAGHTYFYGASSSPKLIIVTRVEPDRVWILDHFGAEWHDAEDAVPRPVERWIAEDLIARGCNRVIDRAGDAIAANEQDGAGEWEKFLVDALMNHTLLIDTPYKFEKRFVCNCCGDDCAVVDGRSDCCGETYRENHRPDCVPVI